MFYIKYLFLLCLIFFISSNASSFFFKTNNKKYVLNKINEMIISKNILQEKNILLNNAFKIKMPFDYFALTGDILLIEKKINEARESYIKALNLTSNKKNKSIIFIKIADTYIINEDKLKAITILNQAISDNLCTDNTYIKLAEIYKSLDIEEKAKEMYLKAEKLNKNNPETNMYLALCNEKILNYDKAIDGYELGLSLNSNQYKVYINLAVLYFKIGLYYKAIDSLYKTKEYFDTPKVMSLLGDIFYIKHNYNDSLFYYNKSILMEQDNRYNYFSLYVTLMKLNKLEEAKNIKNKISKLFGDNFQYNESINEFDKLLNYQ